MLRIIHFQLIWRAVADWWSFQMGTIEGWLCPTEETPADREIREEGERIRRRFRGSISMTRDPGPTDLTRRRNDPTARVRPASADRDCRSRPRTADRCPGAACDNQGEHRRL
jgi:hypothetical protein